MCFCKEQLLTRLIDDAITSSVRKLMSESSSELLKEYQTNCK